MNHRISSARCPTHSHASLRTARLASPASQPRLSTRDSGGLARGVCVCDITPERTAGEDGCIRCVDISGAVHAVDPGRQNPVPACIRHSPHAGYSPPRVPVATVRFPSPRLLAAHCRIKYHSGIYQHPHPRASIGPYSRIVLCKHLQLHGAPIADRNILSCHTDIERPGHAAVHQLVITPTRFIAPNQIGCRLRVVQCAHAGVLRPYPRTAGHMPLSHANCGPRQCAELHSGADTLHINKNATGVRSM